MAFLLLLAGATMVSYLLFGEEAEASARTLLELASSRPLLTAALVVVLLAADILLPVPSSLVAAFAGAALGLAFGTAAVWTGLMAGCVIGYWLGRLVRVRTTSFATGDPAGALRVAGPLVLAVTRAIPIAAETSVIAAGVARMSFGSVMLATALANLLVALAFVGAGALAASLDPLFAAVAATFLFASAWGLWLLVGRRKPAGAMRQEIDSST